MNSKLIEESSELFNGRVITFCFYEYPKALCDIKEWGEKFKDEIFLTIKSFDDPSDVIYVLENEILLCTSKDFDIENFTSFLQHCNITKLNYNKTIVFGKFTSKELQKISKFIKEYE